MGEAVFPPCWFFGLRQRSTAAYRIFGGANGRLWEASHQWVLPRTSAASVLFPAVSHSHPSTSAGDPLTLAGRSGSVSYGVTAPSPWVLVCTLFCVCPPSVEFLFPPSPVEVLQSNLTGLQSPVLWGFLILLPDPQLGNPHVGLRTFTPVGGLLRYNCSPVCVSPTQQLWDLILSWWHPFYRLIAASPLSLDVGYLFWGVPVSSCRWLLSS